MTSKVHQRGCSNSERCWLAQSSLLVCLRLELYFLIIWRWSWEKGGMQRLSVCREVGFGNLAWAMRTQQLHFPTEKSSFQCKGKRKEFQNKSDLLLELLIWNHFPLIIAWNIKSDKNKKKTSLNPNIKHTILFHCIVQKRLSQHLTVEVILKSVHFFITKQCFKCRFLFFMPLRGTSKKCLKVFWQDTFNRLKMYQRKYYLPKLKLLFNFAELEVWPSKIICYLVLSITNLSCALLLKNKNDHPMCLLLILMSTKEMEQEQ